MPGASADYASSAAPSPALTGWRRPARPRNSPRCRATAPPGRGGVGARCHDRRACTSRRGRLRRSSRASERGLGATAPGSTSRSPGDARGAATRGRRPGRRASCPARTTCLRVTVKLPATWPMRPAMSLRSRAGRAGRNGRAGRAGGLVWRRSGGPSG